MHEAIVRSIARSDNGSVIFLEPKDLDVVVPIVIRKLEEESVLIGMSNLPSSRPLAHDLFISQLKKCKCILRRVEVHEYKDALFYARMLIKMKKMRRYYLDARPSDAIAIAVRAHVPIYLANKVIENTAISTNIMQSEDQSRHTHSNQYNQEMEIDQLEHDLQRAIEKESYEEAARIRDKIQKLR